MKQSNGLAALHCMAKRSTVSMPASVTSAKHFHRSILLYLWEIGKSTSSRANGQAQPLWRRCGRAAETLPRTTGLGLKGQPYDHTIQHTPYRPYAPCSYVSEPHSAAVSRNLGVSPARMTLSLVAMHSTSSPDR